MSDAPNPPKEVEDAEKTTSGQLSLWPDIPEESSDNPEIATSSDSSIDAIEDASCILPFGETLLALASIKGLGFRTLISFFKAFGGRIEDVWDVPPVELQLRLESFKISSLDKVITQIKDQREPLLQQGKKRYKELSERDIRIIPLQKLPLSLREIQDAPCWLFVQGDYKLLYQRPGVAVVGTRQPTPKGILATSIVARHIAAYPVTLVSGLAEGIDETAHQISLQEGLKNIAFLGHGLDIIFPASTKSIREKIIEKGGAIVSEYLPQESYKRDRFVARNRLQAAISDLVIPVEANPKGGTAHTIRFARQFKRRLLGIKWDGADGVLHELEKAGDEIVDVFTQAGRRKFDRIIRELAEQHGRPTYALSAVERRLLAEIEQRDLREADVRRLIRSLEGLLREE